MKIETALRLFAESLDAEVLLAATRVPGPKVVTPLMFQYQLIDRARATPPPTI